MSVYAGICTYTPLVTHLSPVLITTALNKDVNPDLPSYLSQVAQLDNTFAAYGPSRILGVTVGNEYILNAPSRGDTIANATTWLISRINDYKAHLTQLTTSSNGATNYTSIPVGTSDAAGTYIDGLITAPDYLFVNIHPWFSDNTYEQAAWFSSTYMQNVVIPLIDTSLTSAAPPGATSTSTSTAGTPASTGMSKGPELFQGEFGWPTATDSAPLGINAAGSPAGIPEMQRVLEYVAFYFSLLPFRLLRLGKRGSVIHTDDLCDCVLVIGCARAIGTGQGISGLKRMMNRGRPCMVVSNNIGGCSIPRGI
jgi:hypothetical protein